MNHEKATTNHLHSIWYSTIINFLHIYYSMFAQMVNQCSLCDISILKYSGFCFQFWRSMSTPYYGGLGPIYFLPFGHLRILRRFSAKLPFQEAIVCIPTLALLFVSPFIPPSNGSNSLPLFLYLWNINVYVWERESECF